MNEENKEKFLLRVVTELFSINEINMILTVPKDKLTVHLKPRAECLGVLKLISW